MSEKVLTASEIDEFESNLSRHERILNDSVADIRSSISKYEEDHEKLTFDEMDFLDERKRLLNKLEVDVENFTAAKNKAISEARERLKAQEKEKVKKQKDILEESDEKEE